MSSKSLKYVFVSVGFGLALGFTAANLRATGASAAARPASLPPAAQGSDEDKPVEQTRKNIQVLKGLPSSQLFSLMNFVGASLGVKCDYCHVKQGKEPETGRDKWVWESDDKETKRTARRMMQMVLSVNNTNRADFRGNPVTCYTCHRGQTEPVRLPQLPLTASAHEDGGAIRPAAAAAESLPGVEQILNKYTEAVGGRAAAAKSQTRFFKGTIEQSQGRQPAIEVTFKEPDKYLIVLRTKQQGIIYQGFDGKSGWIKTDQERREMDAGELAQVRRAAAFYQIIKVKEPYTGMTVTGKEKVGERDAYVLERKSEGGRTEKFYFDTETGLLLRRIVLTDTVLFPIPEQTDFEDYREVDGVRLPFTIRISNIDTYFNS
ncbi:MAG TPA: c-type cytochrome, partial [Pyrinomonadaceae bacterium]|nr:c-type cytochrome [Pyrinomonadaceae bacterium]